MSKGYCSTVVVIKPSGVLNASNAKDFQTQMVSALKSEQVEGLVVDLEQVELVDSATLASMVTALKAAQASSKGFSLRSVPPSIRIVLELTQLDRAFEIVDRSGQAVPQAA